MNPAKGIPSPIRGDLVFSCGGIVGEWLAGLRAV